MTMKIWTASIALIVLAGCETNVPKIGPDVEERSPDQVASCTLIGDVRAIPKLFGVLKSVAQEDAERVAKRQVQEAGGNVVVFDPIDVDADVFQVTGRAYRC